MNRLGTLASIVASGLVLAFVASQSFSLWQSFSYQPALGTENPSPTNYPGLSSNEIGEVVFDTQGCISCHDLDLAGGILAPSLDNVAARHDATWLREKLQNPHASLPGTYMPAFAHLSQEEIDGLVAFLETLTPQRPGADNTGAAQIELPKDAQGQPRFTMADVDRGEELFRAQGCIGCHTVNGMADGGQLGPNLTHEAQRRRSDEWQLLHLVNPASVYMIAEDGSVQWIMPSYEQLSQEDLRALVAFLQSLK